MGAKLRFRPAREQFADHGAGRAFDKRGIGQAAQFGRRGPGSKRLTEREFRATLLIDADQDGAAGGALDGGGQIEQLGERTEISRIDRYAGEASRPIGRGVRGKRTGRGSRAEIVRAPLAILAAWQAIVIFRALARVLCSSVVSFWLDRVVWTRGCKARREGSDRRGASKVAN